MPSVNVGIQLYTVRDLLERDFAGTLARVREIGYTHGELAGLGKRSAAEAGKVCREAALTPVANHFPIEMLESSISRVVEDAKTLGVDYAVCPYLPEDRRSDEAGWRRSAEVLNAAGRALREAGVTFCYHHHSFEFVRVGGRYAFDLLFEETDARYVQCELDTYWIKHGGEDPAAYLRKLAGRCPLLHLKDMMPDEKRSFGEVGEGTLAWPDIFAAAEQAGAAWAFVEQDVCPGDPLRSIATSLENLKRMGYA